jgi:hypothetical protein
MGNKIQNRAAFSQKQRDGLPGIRSKLGRALQEIGLDGFQMIKGTKATVAITRIARFQIRGKSK